MSGVLWQALIDGYNVTHAPSGHFDQHLEVARNQLLRLAEGWRYQVALSEIYVVFDGPGHVDTRGKSMGRLREIYAAGSADAFIRRHIQQAEAPERLVIVSNDREIQHTAKVHGARRVSVAEFLRQSGTPQRYNRTAAEAARGLDARTAEAITRELFLTWCHEDQEEVE